MTKITCALGNTYKLTQLLNSIISILHFKFYDIVGAGALPSSLDRFSIEDDIS